MTYEANAKTAKRIKCKKKTEQRRGEEGQQLGGTFGK